MADIWFTSDSHFFHENILKFTGNDGARIRPAWATVDEMNWDMVERWNSFVKPGDKVWHLGDVAFKTTERAAELDNLLGKLHGHKRMLVGNHDNLKSPALHRHFEKIELWKGFKDEGFTCSHIPLRLDSLRDGAVNVHGHIHQNMMMEPGYVNVCVEVRNYTPVHMDQIKAEVKRVAQ
jgi:calcineurin-like phosphoesterase family protein